LEEKEDKKVKEKKKIEKINIIDDEIPSNNLILHNPKYAGNKNEENEINLLGKLFSNKPEVAPINISKELKEKIKNYNRVKDPKEKLNINYIYNNKEYKNKLPIHKYSKQNNKLSLLFNFFNCQN